MPVSASSAEMQFFSDLVRCGSLSAAARELQVSTAAVSKRLAQLEAQVVTKLSYEFREVVQPHVGEDDFLDPLVLQQIICTRRTLQSRTQHQHPHCVSPLTKAKNAT